MSKTQDEAYNLLEEMAMNNYQWPRERLAPKKILGTHEADAISALTSQVQELSQQLKAIHLAPQKVQATFMRCELCSGPHK